MVTAVALLALSLCYLSVAEVQELDPLAGQENVPNIPGSRPTLSGAGDPAESQNNYCDVSTCLIKPEARLQDIEKQLEDLRRSIQAERVAFAASIGSVGHQNLGPYNVEITLKYTNVFTNTGAYNPTTGIFTAPVRGAYHFSFTGLNIASKGMGLRLMKNGEQMVTVFSHVSGRTYETTTNSIILQLQQADQVYVTLREDTWIFDNSNDHSTFIGHLLFQL